jgi:hypothetical protein
MQAGVAFGQPIAPRPRRTPLGISADVGGQTRSPSLSLPISRTATQAQRPAAPTA